MARRTIVVDGEEGLFHCISRCVRRAFLCGYDEYAGKDYSHRKAWVQDRLRKLSGIFAIEVCAYAVMSNHQHLVLWTRPKEAEQWSNEEVVRRWLMLFPLPHRRDGMGCVQDPTEEDVAEVLHTREEDLEKWRDRLASISWFMRCLNEAIARRANQEDACTGRFWEGRFKCQKLADEGAVLACMAYVDLNPVRAEVAHSLEESEFTSICDRVTARQGQERLKKMKQERRDAGTRTPYTEAQKELVERTRSQAEGARWLSALEGGGSGKPGKAAKTKRTDKGSEKKTLHDLLGVGLEDYVSLVEWTGMQIREEKGQGHLPEGMLPLVERLDLDASKWVKTVQGYGSLFHRVAGKAETLARVARATGQHWFQGIKSGMEVFTGADPPGKSARSRA